MTSTPSSHPQKAVHSQSLADRESFWLKAANDVHWHRHPDRAFGPSQRTGNTPRHGRESDGVWFPGGQISTTFNCLDRHVYPPPTPHSPPLTPSPHTPHLPFDPSLAKRVAFRHISPLPWQTVQERTITYGDALENVQVLAGVLKSKGVGKGDVVTVYMSESIETALAILAITRIGAVFSVVFGGFASKELAKRIEDSKCKMIITSSCGLEPKGPVPYKPLVDEALRICASRHVPASGVLFQRRHGIRDHEPPAVDNSRNEWDWDEEMALTRKGEGGRSPCWASHPVASEDPLYLLYTSGSTGNPKGVVRSAGGHAVSLRYYIEHIFGMKKDDLILTTSSFGWVVGCSYILFGPLLLGASSIIFEGKPILPDAGILWRTVSNHGVTHLFTAPTALRAVRGADPEAAFMRAAGVNLKSLRTLFLAGERSEPGIVELYGKLLRELGAPGANVNDNYWSTESGNPITALQITPAFAPLVAKPGSAGVPLPGMDVRIVDEEGKEISKAGEMGNLVLAPPLAPSALLGLWHNPAGFEKSYWDRFSGKGGWFDTGDSAYRDADGYVTICARGDDLINVAAHRLGTGLIEAVVTAHPDIVECCVVGAPDPAKGQVPFALVVVAQHHKADVKSMMKSINDHIRQEVGPIAQLGAVIATGKLPKTRSGKTLRRTIRAMVENAAEGKKDQEVPYPPTIEDKDVLAPIQASIEAHFASAGGTKAKL